MKKSSLKEFIRELFCKRVKVYSGMKFDVHPTVLLTALLCVV